MLSHKHLSLVNCDIKAAQETATFVGYASRFNGVDQSGDTILKGAYAQTLKERMPKMFIQHDGKGLPVGKWTSAVEDDHGLRVEGEFTPGMAKAEEVRAALLHGTVDGLSIGYMLQKNDYEEKNGVRIIRNISRLVEISIVTFPMDLGARVDLSTVKAEEIEALSSEREFEDFLRSDLCLSKAMTEMLASRAKAIYGRGDPAAEIDAKVARGLEERILMLRLQGFPKLLN